MFCFQTNHFYVNFKKKRNIVKLSSTFQQPKSSLTFLVNFTIINTISCMFHFKIIITLFSCLFHHEMTTFLLKRKQHVYTCMMSTKALLLQLKTCKHNACFYSLTDVRQDVHHKFMVTTLSQHRQLSCIVTLHNLKH